MFGSCAIGPLADHVGRKWAMRISSALCVIGWIAVFLSQSVWPLDLGRLCNGIGVGMFSYLAPVYVAEIAPRELRGKLVTLSQLMLVLGTSIFYVLGTVLSWRILAIVGTIPCLIQLIGLLFIQESPRWLAKVGRSKEFESTLRSLRGMDADINQEATDIQDNVEYLALIPKARIQDLFKRKYSRSIIVGVGLMALENLGGNAAIQYYASDILVSAGFSSGSVGIVTVAVMQVPLTILVAYLLDRTGRKPMLLIGAFGTCLGTFMVGTSFLLKDHEGSRKLILALNLMGILVYFAFYLSIGGATWVMMSEIFDLNIKGIAGGLTTMVNWLTAWISSYTYNYLYSWSTAGTFYTYSGICAAAILFVIKLVPETKGRTLEEIQVSMYSLGLFGFGME